MVTALSLCNLTLFISSRKHCGKGYGGLRPAFSLRVGDGAPYGYCDYGRRKSFGRFVVLAVTEGSAKSRQSDEKIPSWAKPDSDEPPPWARDEGNKNSSEQSIEIPFYVYLLASAVMAIAAIGSIFEYANQKPVFGVLNSDSLFYAPVLGFFVITGIPTSAFLWFKSVQAANKASEEQDRRDGFL